MRVDERPSARLRSILLWSTAALLVGLGGVSIAAACGGFFRAKTVAPEQQPSLSREKVLLIHDAGTGQQHFIREVAFARATEPFGFVVPTPTRPSVASIEATPFTKLRDAFPFSKPPPVPRGGSGGSGKGFGGPPPAGGVTVLEVQKIGSFTAFVLAATDAEALALWLSDNQLVSTKQADAWLDHYVGMGFYYVAMRYDPPRGDDARPTGDAIEAETMRISFATPVPYYPYLEPEPPPGAPLRLGFDPRLLELWYVGTEQVIPVALREHEGERSWVRPLHEGQVFEDARVELESVLDPALHELLPAGELVVQTFQDQKSARAGLQDVVFASKQAKPPTRERREALEPMLAILDPSLAPSRPPTPPTEEDQP